MANRFWFERVRHLLVGRADIVGSFEPNGSSALDATLVYGKGFTVARTGVGTFTITFADQYAKLMSATGSIQLTSADDKFVQIGAFNKASKTLVIRIWDVSGAAATDVASGLGRVNFNVVFSVSGVD